MIAKTVLAIAIFTGLGTIVIGGGVVIMKYYGNEVSDRIVKPVDQETENYYDVLEKKCAGDNCCLSSLKTMRENNYKEADENGKCPDGFYMDMMKCVTSYQWYAPIEEEKYKISLEPKNVALFKKEIPDANNQCVSHPQIVSYSPNIIDGRFTLMEINSRKLEKNKEAIENIIKFIKDGEIPKKIVKVSTPKGIIEEERQGIGSLHYDAFRNYCGGSMISLIGEIENIFYPGTDGVRAVYVWEGQDIPGLVKVRIYAYYKDYVIELSSLVSNEDYLENYLMDIIKKCEENFSDEEIYGKGGCFSKTVASDKILKQKAKETADELVKLFELNDEQITSDWQTYRNEEFGYEVKYSKNIVEIFPDSVFERGSEGNPSFRIKSGGHFALGVWENPKDLTAKEWIDKQYAEYSGGWIWDFKETTVGTEKAFSALRTDMCHIEWVIIPKLNYFYTFGTEICEDDRNASLEIFDQILSTFKFVEN